MNSEERSHTVYLAGSFSQRNRIRELMTEFERKGYRVPYDWTTHTPIRPYGNNPILAGHYAQEDIGNAANCDVFVLQPEAEGGSTLFTELGAAIVSPIVQKYLLLVKTTPVLWHFFTLVSEE